MGTKHVTNIQWVNEEIKKEVKKYLKRNDNETQPFKIYVNPQKHGSEGSS